MSASTRPSFWLALLTAVCATGVWKVVDATTAVIARLATIEAKIDASSKTSDTIERRVEALEHNGPK